jgi:hypothetical protein
VPPIFAKYKNHVSIDTAKDTLKIIFREENIPKA